MVKKMWKNVREHLISPTFKKNKGWNASFFWSCKDHIKNNYYSSSKDIYFPEKTIAEYQAEAELKVSQIQDPLWQKACKDILGILGPLAFKDFWKTKLISISVEGKRAYFSCPNEPLALTLQLYHFVIIGALKKFYPFLSSIEVEVSEDKERYIPANKSSKISVSLNQQVN